MGSAFIHWRHRRVKRDDYCLVRGDRIIIYVRGGYPTGSSTHPSDREWGLHNPSNDACDRYNMGSVAFIVALRAPLSHWAVEKQSCEDNCPTLSTAV